MSVLKRELTPEQIEKVLLHLQTKWVRPCPMCAHNEWQIATPLQLHVDATWASPLMPVIAVACQNCGNTVLVSSVIVGIDPPQPEPQ